MRGGVLGMVLAVLPVAAWAYTWADDPDYAKDAEFKDSRAICAGLRKVALPAADQGDRRAQGGMAGCSSEALYYGIGIPADAKAAFACAQLEASDTMFGGDMMLVTLYANGKGVAHDLDKAIALACRSKGAAAEMHGRILDLQALRGNPSPQTEFHWCDNATSGYLVGFCGDQGSRMAKAKRQAEFPALAARFAMPGAQDTLKAVIEARDVFAKALTEEVSHSGTMSAADEIWAVNGLEQDFHDDLKTLADKSRVWEDAAKDKGADAELNTVYKRVMAYDFCSAMECDKARQIRQAQRVWLKYRDSWAAFAENVGGKSMAQAAVNLQTRHRIAGLKQVIGED